MARRHLSEEERALWAAVARTVRPLRRAVPKPKPAADQAEPPAAIPKPPPKVKRAARPVIPPPPPPATRAPAPTLDTSWEKRIRGGTLAPDVSIDLHGHTLAAAHARLIHAVQAALAQDARVMLVVTGKPPRGTEAKGEGSRRGAIRAEIGHWLQTMPYADRIASVRIAHPRHGGDGALYIILRRRK